MKKHVIKWGLISGAFLLSTFMITGLMRDYENPNYDLGEIIGFSLMILSMGFIFLGIKAYRDQNNGSITFVEGLKLGLLISIFPTVAFIAYNFIYLHYIDPDFMENYYSYQLENAAAQMTESDFELFKIQTENEMELFSSDFMQALIYFLTNGIIGLIITLVAVFLMKRKYEVPLPSTE